MPLISPFARSEGGELRLERLQQSADNSVQYLASQAFFFKGQTPDTRDIGRPDLELLSQPLLDQGYSCQDFRAGDLFENGFSAAAQMIADTREYHDVGESVTLTNVADPADVITLARRTDPEEAIDLSAGLTHDTLYRGFDGQGVTLGTIYQPAIPGSPAYSSLDLRWGQSVSGDKMADQETGRGTPQIYMPSAFTLTSPTEEEYFTADFLTFTKGRDYEIRYDFEPAPEGWPTILPFVSLLDAGGQIVVNCVKVPVWDGLKPDDGTFVLPADALQFLGEVEPGRVIVGRLAHVAWEFSRDYTRLDFIGIESKLSPTAWKLQDAPVEAN